ncbi:MAG: hypothetical protein J6R44_01615, partial [Clostridia bacterium]|nr:hypothetical protein [Clostridia bacterium]
DTAPESVNICALDKESSDSFGKFKTAQELKTAYQNLEQEFTRKSQRLKEVERELEKGRSAQRETDKWTERVKELHAKYPCSQSLGEEITAYVKENKGLMEKENCLETALLHVLAMKFESQKNKGNTPKAPLENAVISVEKPQENKGNTPAEILKRHARKRENMPLVLDGGEMTVAPRANVHTVKDASKLATERLKNYKK